MAISADYYLVLLLFALAAATVPSTDPLYVAGGRTSSRFHILFNILTS